MFTEHTIDIFFTTHIMGIQLTIQQMIFLYYYNYKPTDFNSVLYQVRRMQLMFITNSKINND